MNRTGLIFEANQLNLTLSANGWHYGVIDLWPVALAQVNRTVQLQVVPEQKQGKANVKALKRECKGWARIQWNTNVLLLTLRPNKFTGNIADCIKAAVRSLGRAGLTPSPVCPLCKNGNCDVTAPFGNTYRQTHRSCLSLKAAEARQKNERNKSNGSYLTGIIGAIIGGIIGCIPSVLSIILADTIYALLFAIIPICSYFGYKLLNGKMDKVALICSVVMALLGVYIINFIVLGYYAADYYDINFKETLQIMPLFLTDGETWVSITKDSLLEFFFAALGLLFAWRIISRTGNQNAEAWEAVFRAAEPYPPVEGGEASAEPAETACIEETF